MLADIVVNTFQGMEKQFIIFIVIFLNTSNTIINGNKNVYILNELILDLLLRRGLKELISSDPQFIHLL